MRYSYAITGLLTLAFSSPALADDCSDACAAAHDACATQPEANQATCASEYAACLGYNPYDPSFVEPTACSQTTATGSATTATSVTMTTAASTGAVDACAADCIAKHEQCQTQPNANMAVCAASFSECLNYNPYSPSYVAPTACSKTATGSTTMASPTHTGKPDGCAQSCIGKHEKCQTQPNANMAVCASEFAACLGYNPYEPSYVAPTACSGTVVTPAVTTDDYVIVTAAADRMQPVLGLLALGAAALL